MQNNGRYQRADKKIESWAALNCFSELSVGSIYELQSKKEEKQDELITY